MPTFHDDKVGRITQIEKALPKDGILIYVLRNEIKSLFLLADNVCADYTRLIALRNIVINGKVYPKDHPPKDYLPPSQSPLKTNVKV
jgi:hypothetical protein